jgi:hypothetical protein
MDTSPPCAEYISPVMSWAVKDGGSESAVAFLQRSSPLSQSMEQPMNEIGATHLVVPDDVVGMTGSAITSPMWSRPVTTRMFLILACLRPAIE